MTVTIGTIAKGDSAAGISVAVPSNSDGDYLYLFSFIDEDDGAFNSISGWTPISILSGTAADGRDRTWTLQQRQASSEPANYSVSWDSGTGRDILAVIINAGAFGSLDVTPSIDHLDAGSNDSTPPVSAITTNNDDVTLVALAGLTNQATEVTAWGAPTAYTLLDDDIESSTAIAVATKIKATAGAESANAWTNTVTGSLSEYVSIIFAVSNSDPGLIISGASNDSPEPGDTYTLTLTGGTGPFTVTLEGQAVTIDSQTSSSIDIITPDPRTFGDKTLLFGQPYTIEVTDTDNDDTASETLTFAVPATDQFFTASGSPWPVTSVAYVAPYDITFDNSTNQVTSTGSNFTAGDGPFTLTTTGTLPSELSAGPIYWVNPVDANSFTLHASESDGTAGTNVIAFTDDGTGTHQLVFADNLEDGDIVYSRWESGGNGQLLPADLDLAEIVLTAGSHELALTYYSGGSWDDEFIIPIDGSAPSSAPVISGSSTPSFPENSTAVFATYTITNREGETPTLTGTDAALFDLTLVSGNYYSLEPVSNQNYEAPGDGNTDGDYDVTINIDNLVDDPVTLAVTATLTNEFEVVIVDAGPLSLEYAYGSAGLAQDDSALLAHIASFTNSEGNDLASNPDPLTEAGSPYTITESATDAADVEWTLTVTEAAAESIINLAALGVVTNGQHTATPDTERQSVSGITCILLNLDGTFIQSSTVATDAGGLLPASIDIPGVASGTSIRVQIVMPTGELSVFPIDTEAAA